MKHVFALVLLVGVAQAEPRSAPNHRFHVVDDSYMKRLSKGAQRNEQSVAAFPHATAFVVSADPARPQRVLVLTNHHVAGAGAPGNIAFRDGTVGVPQRTVAANAALDYALVEVELTSGPRMHGVAPVELERGASPMKADDKIYALGGHTGLDIFQKPSGSIGGGTKQLHAIKTTIADVKSKGDVAGFRTIASGTVFRGTAGPQPVTAANNTTLSIQSELPNAPGMSGSPVISSTTHKVVGLHFAGMGSLTTSWIESAVPMDLLLTDVRQRLASGQVDARARDLVQTFVAGK